MRYQIQVTLKPGLRDSLGSKVARETACFLVHEAGQVRCARLFLLEGECSREEARTLAEKLLVDPLIESFELHDWESYEGCRPGSVTVFKKAGVMDPPEADILRGARLLGLPLVAAKSALSYSFAGLADQQLLEIGRNCLANEAIEVVSVGNDRFPLRPTAKARPCRRREVPLRGAGDDALLRCSQEGGLSLNLEEMRTIQNWFKKQKRDPTDAELETLAQTWSEHCKHKTFCAPIRYRGPDIGSLGDGALIPGLLQSTIKQATEELQREFCLSVFHDNAGIMAFEPDFGLCFKVETHNHPSAIEPYGGAGTGIGGVIRDILGTGLGARPLANIDVFCVGPLDLPPEQLQKGSLHPQRVLRGVVAGVRDYGNQMGIPTVSGGVFVDARYVGNPLVYAGTVGLIPVDKVHKEVHPGDAIVVLGGRTGRDGIHGATFSSVELHEESEQMDAGAVQIGNAITEKKMLDVILAARDRGLFRGITDCGAGGFSSAIGEMGEHCGARVHLERAPLKYAGLSYTEIWISEAQERMVLAVPPEQVEELLALCGQEDVEAVVLGHFSDTGRLELFYENQQVADLEMEFLHHGLPQREREACYTQPAPKTSNGSSKESPEGILLKILASPNVASKGWIIRQFDHEVQAASVIKPLVGRRGQGPSDGVVLAPILGRRAGFALGLGMNPRLGDLDPYHMATAAVDEALRNVVAVGGDPDHCALLDNFSWGNCSHPQRLGELVRAAFGCRDAALAFKTPFISGKDSLNNEYRLGAASIAIPPSLLISAMARVPDVTRVVSMDLKGPGHPLYLLGHTGGKLGGSHCFLVQEIQGGEPPTLSAELARRLFLALHQAIRQGLVLSCHDLAEGGLATAAAEMVLAGEWGARLDISPMPTKEEDLGLLERLFGESLSRFLVELDEEQVEPFEALFKDLPLARLGTTTREARLVIHEAEHNLVDLSAERLEAAFIPPLGRFLEGQAGGSSHG